MPVDHSRALEKMGGALAKALRASWLPKIANGWFFRAESFFSVARYLDDAALTYGGRKPDFLSHSLGEGFLRFFAERCQRQGIFIFDEPGSALSASRQIEFLKLLRAIGRSRIGQVIMQAGTWRRARAEASSPFSTRSAITRSASAVALERASASIAS